MRRGDRQGKARPDAADGHQQLEEGQLLWRGETEERLLILADEVVDHSFASAPTRRRAIRLGPAMTR